MFDHTDRMMAVRQNDDTEVHHYVYDANGTRIMKSTATDRDFYVNNDGTPDWELSPYIVYTGPHYVFQAYKNFVDVSKHYFADGQRVVTKMQLEERYYQAPGHEPGDGPFFNQYDPDATGLPEPESAAINDVVLDQWDEIGTWAGVEGMDAESFSGDQSLPIYNPVGWTRGACFEGGTLFNTEFCDCIDANYEYGSAGYINCIETFPNLYWYHVDYMGHTEYVTDLAGSPYEYYFYMPFGEVAVAQHANNDGYSNPYRFASAEHDPETGFVLMGARYYDPKASIWISADPLSHMRSWLTPYNYSRSNPVMFSDPSGLLDIRVFNGPGDGEVLNEVTVTASAPPGIAHPGIGQLNIQPPTQPTDLRRYIGTESYYEMRAQDYESRNPGKTAPKYYREYGDKYVKRFKNKTRNTLSNRGRDWLDNTLVFLQSRMERRVLVDQGLEDNEDVHYNFAFDTHVDSYVHDHGSDGGLLSLGPNDKVRILLTPDPEDILSEAGIRQAKEVAELQVAYYIDNPSVAVDHAKELLSNIAEISSLIDQYVEEHKDYFDSDSNYDQKRQNGDMGDGIPVSPQGFRQHVWLMILGGS